MSNTQKNWNNYWKDYEPSRYDNIYHNINENDKNHHFDFKKILYMLIPIIVIGIFVMKFKQLTNTYGPINIQQEGIKTAQNSIKIDNKNGITMKNSVNTIQDTLDKIIEDKGTLTEEDIDNYIKTVKETDLSNEYNEYKNKAVEKLKIARCWINTEDVEQRNELIDKYNDINIIEYLTKAFDKVGVDYWMIDDKHIRYTYIK